MKTMHFLTLIFPFVFALVFALLLTYVFERKGPGPAEGLLFFILIIFMFSWVIGSWITPIGPLIMGVPWIEYLFLAFIFMLLLGVLLPPSKPPYKTENKPLSDNELFHEKAAATYPLSITFGIFFWVTMIILLVMGIVKILSLI